MNAISFFLEVSTQISPTAGEAAENTAKSTHSLFGGFFGGSSMQNPVVVIVFYCVILFVAMYFFSIRPTKKRESKLAEMRNSIAIGDTVITNSGLFGKVVDITAECMVVEFGTNKGVRIPVLKSEIYGKREPNLTNKAIEEPAQEKKGLFGFLNKKTDDEKNV